MASVKEKTKKHTKQVKQIKQSDSKKIDESVGDIEKDVMTPKIKVNISVDLEEVEDPIVQDDKLPADPLLEINEIDSELEEIGLDDDELDPFHDKWEQ